MSYKKTPQEQLWIIRQSCLNRAVDLYVAKKIPLVKLQVTAEYFVGLIYSNLGLTVGAAFNEDQTQGAIIFQSSLTRAVEIVVAGFGETKDIAGDARIFADFVYGGTNAKS